MSILECPKIPEITGKLTPFSSKSVAASELSYAEMQPILCKDTHYKHNEKALLRKIKF